MLAGQNPNPDLQALLVHMIGPSGGPPQVQPARLLISYDGCHAPVSLTGARMDGFPVPGTKRVITVDLLEWLVSIARKTTNGLFPSFHLLDCADVMTSWTPE